MKLQHIYLLDMSQNAEVTQLALKENEEKRISPPVNKILKQRGFTLIKKYGSFYITLYLLKYPDIVKEFYEVLMTGTFPKTGIEADGFTAKQLFYEKDLSLWQAYLFLAGWQENNS